MNLFRAIVDTASSRPDRPALICPDGPMWTFEQLCVDVERTAAGLRSRGLVAGDRVLIFLGNDPLFLFVWLAAVRNGQVAVPVNPALTDRELAIVLDTACPAVAVTGAATASVVRGAADTGGLDLDIVVIEDPLDPSSWGELLENDTGIPPSTPGLEDEVEIMYTSGSTGVPKGAVFDHQSHLDECRALVDAFGITPATVTLTVIPLFHMAGIRASALVTWLAGGTVVLPNKFSVRSFWPVIDTFSVTHTITVPAMLVMIDRHGDRPTATRGTLRTIYSTGPPGFLAQFEHRFNVRFLYGYGMTETGTVCAGPHDVTIDEERRLRSRHPEASYIGRPVDDRTLVEIRDASGHRLANGERGELWIRSPSTLLRYAGDEERSRAALVEGWFRTGDIGFRDPDGVYFFVARARELIRRAGENIAPAEIEEVLLAHPDVVAVAAVPVPDDVRGEEGKVFVIIKEGRTLTAADVWSSCSVALAPYKVPRYVEFVNEFPLTASGKVHKEALLSRSTGITYDRTADTVD